MAAFLRLCIHRYWGVLMATGAAEHSAFVEELRQLLRRERAAETAYRAVLESVEVVRAIALPAPSIQHSTTHV
jgi:hypothetical protein